VKSSVVSCSVFCCLIYDIISGFLSNKTYYTYNTLSETFRRHVKGTIVCHDKTRKASDSVVSCYYGIWKYE
jgi:hypothetical protein